MFILCFLFFFSFSFLRALKYNDYGVPSNKELADVPFLVNWAGACGLLLVASLHLWRLCPHLLHPLQDHVAVSVKCLDSPQQLVVIAYIHKNLLVLFHALCQDAQRPCLERLLFLSLTLFEALFGYLFCWWCSSLHFVVVVVLCLSVSLFLVMFSFLLLVVLFLLFKKKIFYGVIIFFNLLNVLIVPKTF